VLQASNNFLFNCHNNRLLTESDKHHPTHRHGHGDVQFFDADHMAWRSAQGLRRPRSQTGERLLSAIGDTIALSVTPEYLVKIGLLDKAPDASRDIGLLLSRALEKVAFLPFGLLIDQWRWKVFSGEITPAQYNTAWWDLRLKYQGVAPPSPRGEAMFDPCCRWGCRSRGPTRFRP
jgi:hypothetical protein